MSSKRSMNGKKGKTSAKAMKAMKAMKARTQMKAMKKGYKPTEAAIFGGNESQEGMGIENHEGHDSQVVQAVIDEYPESHDGRESHEDNESVDSHEGNAGMLYSHEGLATEGNDGHDGNESHAGNASHEGYDRHGVHASPPSNEGPEGYKPTDSHEGHDELPLPPRNRPPYTRFHCRRNPRISIPTLPSDSSSSGDRRISGTYVHPRRL